MIKIIFEWLTAPQKIYRLNSEFNDEIYTTIDGNYCSLLEVRNNIIKFCTHISLYLNSQTRAIPRSDSTVEMGCNLRNMTLVTLHPLVLFYFSLPFFFLFVLFFGPLHFVLRRKSARCVSRLSRKLEFKKNPA